MNQDRPVALQLESLTKSFGGVCVLDHVSFEILEGGVHCILGENGAGKSTLIKIISGAYKADEGSVIRCSPTGYCSSSTDSDGSRNCGWYFERILGI